MSSAPLFTLQNGVSIPAIGLGTYGLNEDTMLSSLEAAYRSGASLIDTASAYDNEQYIGKAISFLSSQGILNRHDLFIETKVGDKLYKDGSPQGYYFFNSSSCPNHDVKFQVMEQVERSLMLLNTDLIDLLLIHWPYNDVLCEIWKCLEDLYDQKIVRSIGVSNFKKRHLQTIMKKANYCPMVDQLCISPINLLVEDYLFCQEYHIQIEAYSPLNTLQNSKVQSEYPDFYGLSAKYEKSMSQVLLRWFYQKGIITIPKSGNPERVRMNNDIFGFTLDEDDVKYIDSMNYDFQYLVESMYCPGY